MHTSDTEKRIISAPLTDEIIKTLHAGEMVYITGTIYTARDAAHKRLCEMLKRGEEMPFDFEGQIVYYAGPAPAKPGEPIGSVGPTTAGRMDAYTPTLVEHGLRAMIGKGARNQAVIDSLKNHCLGRTYHSRTYGCLHPHPRGAWSESHDRQGSTQSGCYR